MKRIRPFLWIQVALGLGAVVLRGAETLTLESVWRLALAATPETRVLEEERAAIAGEADQAGRLPNPTLGAELEGLGVRHPYRGFDEAELTVQLRQEYVRSGKRSAARRLVEAEAPVAEAEFNVRLAELRQRVATAFHAVHVAQEQAALSDDAVDLAVRTLQSTQRLHEAGQATGVELSRAALDLAGARAKAEAAGIALKEARRALVLQWKGNPEGPLDDIRVGPAALSEAMPELTALQEKLPGSPDLRWFDAEAGRRRAEVEVVKWRPTRDIGVGGGVRILRREENATLLVGIDVPLLTRNRYEGALAAARARERLVEQQKASATLTLRAGLAARYAELASARSEWTNLEALVLPAATDVVARSRAAFDQGQTSLLQLLEAQGALLAAREQRLAAITRYLEAKVAIERLLGVSS